MSEVKARYEAGGSASEALAYGLGHGARRLQAGGLPPVTGAAARWRPLPGGAGLELVDRQGHPLGWALVPLSRVAGLRPAPQAAPATAWPS